MGFRVFHIVVGVLLGGVTIGLLASALPASAIVAIAKRVESGVSLDRHSAAKIEPLLERRYSCQRDIQRSALSLHLALLDEAMDLNAAPDHIINAYEGAVAHLKRELMCFPLDGNAWLRLAMIDVAFSGPTDRAVAYVKMSQQTNPYEEWVLRVRIPLLVALAQTQSSEVDGFLAKDLSILMQHGGISAIREVWAKLGSYGKALMAEKLSELSAERRQLLEQAFSKA